jgi:hypothetical protein
MADVSDVSNALVTLIAQTLYPNGIGQASAITAPVRVFPGWPNPQQLDADLTAGVVNVSVYPTQIERNTTRYPKNDFQDLAINATTLTLTINAQQITVGGAMPTTFYAQNVMAMVSGVPYVYATQSGDTLTSIATALAALIPGASSVGAVVTVPNGKPITAARVGTIGTRISEVRRQERVFMLGFWAPTPALRDSAAAIIDLTLAGITFLTLADGSAARLIYRSSTITDTLEKSKLYRRDLNYAIEYATTQIDSDVQVNQIQVNEGVNVTGATTTTSSNTTNI